MKMCFNYYQIVNNKNEKKYIGITKKNVEIRFKEHRSLLEKNRHPNFKLQKDWNLFGEENFSFVLIESCECETIEIGYNHEYELISSENDLYNIALGGQINPMYSQEIKEKMTKTKQDNVPNIYQLEEIEENVFKIIQKFNSQKDAQRITGLSQANICKSLKTHIKGSGYYWIKEEELSSFEQEWKPKRTKMTPTAQLDDKLNIVKVHHNRATFEKENSWSSGIITNSLKRDGKAFGIKFKNITEEEYYKIKPIILVQ